MPAFTQALIKFQIGPVQDFIAAARSTRDLWSGSYLLSWLTAAGIRHLLHKEAELVFPSGDNQPLLAPDFDRKDATHPTSRQLRTPNLTNIFIVLTSADSAESLAREARQKIEDEWNNIATSVWEYCLPRPPLSDAAQTYFKQTRGFFSVSWQVTLVEGTSDAAAYKSAYESNARSLNGVRQTREFSAWAEGKWKVGHEKDSLTGKEESLVDDIRLLREPKKLMREECARLFKNPDPFGAITLIKRVWHLAYLRETKNSLEPIPSVLAIAARTDESDDERNIDATPAEGAYIAAIAFDGDAIGKWISGRGLSDTLDLHRHQKAFSKALSSFALEKARKTVNQHRGFLIYAGGDDVLALVPADKALICAADLRREFQTSTAQFQDQDGERPDASAGIVIAHVYTPLQDLIQAARTAEERAKNVVGRKAFSVTLMKRSGEITEWGAQWDSQGLQLCEQIAACLTEGTLASRFPHRVCALLEPYRSRKTGLTRSLPQSSQASLDAFTVAEAEEVIHREFEFAIARHAKSYPDTSSSPPLSATLKSYLSAILKQWNTAGEDRKNGSAPREPSAVQQLLSDVIGLCTTVAFAHRTRTDSSTSRATANLPD
ncbi:type III-B CRISPR-associated protein Cas10/Cmr2 [Verrucomicrobium spinosum]|uniref:type III-B CRISPR-associated protein Cas10/Cmr2 n=2 Tax=Verrucomicrobium spinosum TaxID=2736 RepID=UPI000174439E|nr:type III-B CRISPR-associated protein Cas10/Cmr2 [Verrucomicrobium spinosum]